MWPGGTTVGPQQLASPLGRHGTIRAGPRPGHSQAPCVFLLARCTTSPARDLDYGIITTKDLWPHEAWAPTASRAPHRAALPAHVTNNPQFNDDDSSSTSEVSMDHKARHEQDEGTQPQAEDLRTDDEAPNMSIAATTTTGVVAQVFCSLPQSDKPAIACMHSRYRFSWQP